MSDDQPISDLLPAVGKPALQALALAGYTSLEQLTTVSEAELIKLHGVGPKALGVLRDALAERGLAFGHAKRAGD